MKPVPVPGNHLPHEVRRLALSVLMPGFVGTTLPRWLEERLAQGLGGVCLFGHNVESPAQVRALTGAVHAAGPRALVASDEEGGSVSRLDAGAGSPWPGHATLGALDDPDATYAVALGLGHGAADAGLDLVLAPVLDVNSEPDNPVIGVRSFGATPELVARHGAAFVRGLQDGGVAACGKHYPGHGATRTDSHVELPVLDVDEETWRTRDLPPFEAAVEAGIASVMTAHVVLTALDDRPATLSARALGALRRDLGFQGAIVSDALDMKAISAGVGRPAGAVQCLAAGVDLVCIGNPSFPATYDDEAVVDELADAIVSAVATGDLSLDRLEEASARVGALSTRQAPTHPDPPGEAFGTDVAARALTVRGDVRVTGDAVVVFPRPPFGYAAGRMPSALLTRLRASRPSWQVREVDDPLAARRAAQGAGAVLLVVEGRYDPDVAASVRAVLEVAPDAVVVYGGLARADDPGRHTVHSHGTGAATARAVAGLLLGDDPR